MPDLTFSSIEQRFVEAIAGAAELDLDRFARPGTIVVPARDREGSAMAAIYRIGSASLVWCDPAITERVAALADDASAFPVEGVAAWAGSVGGEFVGGAWSHLIDPKDVELPDPPGGHAIRLLDREAEEDRELIAGLVEVCGEDDADYAEIDLDDLDPLIVGLVDRSSILVGYAGGVPWEHDDGFGDIGVLTHAERRGEGLGRTVVAHLVGEMLRTGVMPLYRCNWDRTPSRRLALSLGFREVLSLAAVRFE